MKTTRIDVATLAHHLSVAARVYREDVEKCDAAAQHVHPGSSHPEAMQRLATQFKRQALECEAWVRALDGHTEIDADGDMFLVREFT